MARVQRNLLNLWHLFLKMKGNVWILGYFNYPKFTFDAEHIQTVKPGCSYHQLYGDFTSLLHEYSLFQTVSEPTRGENTLDLFLTSNPTLVNKRQIKPGLADHNVMQ